MVFEPTVATDPRLSRPTFAEIDLDRLTANYRAVEAAAGGAGMLPVLKANAYGHGLIPVARHLEALGAAGLAVAFLEEGALLREAGPHLSSVRSSSWVESTWTRSRTSSGTA